MTKVTFEKDLSVENRFIVRSTEFNDDDSYSPVCIGFVEKEFSDTPFFFAVDKSVAMMSEVECLAIGGKLRELNNNKQSEFPWEEKHKDCHYILDDINVVRRGDDDYWEVFYPGFDFKSDRIFAGAKVECLKFSEENYIKNQKQ